MRKLLVAVIALALLSTTSLMAQHGDQGERVEKIIEIIGGPSGSHGSTTCDKSFSFGQASGHAGCGSFGHGSECGNKSDHIMMMSHLLDLTDEQQAKMKKMKLEFALKLVDAKAELKKAKLKLKAIMHDENPDKSKVFSGIDKVSDREADIKKMKFANKLNMHSILTKEQLEKAKRHHGSAGGDHKIFEWRSDGAHSGLHPGGKRTIEFIGEGSSEDSDGNVFIIKKEHK